MRNSPKFIVVGLLALLSVACASPKVGDTAAIEFAGQDLHPVRSSGFESAYVHPQAELASYKSIDITPLDVASLEITQTTVPGTNRRDWVMSPEREQRLTEAWQSATDRTFSDYQGQDSRVLKLTAQLTQLRPGRSAGTIVGTSGAPVRGTGDTVDVSAEFRIYDRASDQLLAVIRDRQTIASLQWSRAEGVDMVNLFNSWAGLLHTRISGR